MVIVIVIVIGLVIGSFLNAVIFRLHSQESFFSGRSKCPHCQHPLAPADLVPLFSFMLLRGRCRYCHKPISWQYPMVEAITAAVFALLSIQYPVSSIQFWLALIFASVMIVIAVYDFKHYLILDKVIWPTALFSIIVNLVFGWHYALVNLLCGLALAGFFAAQYFFSRGRWIGLGDVKLGFLLGNILGWPLTITCLVLAYFSGALVGVGLIAAGRKHLSSKIAFGTFLGGSAILTMIYGQQLTSWYLHLIGI